MHKLLALVASLMTATATLAADPTCTSP
ncbi:MAG: hypothetical protein RLZZ373_2946, partial [Pseudomonadota bacterium]